VPFGKLEMTAADVLGALITAAWEKVEQDEHTWSMERLRERDVQQGDGAQISLRGNQHHISTYLQTLLEMLGGGKRATLHTRATTLLKATKNQEPRP
jgi:hypothetical protein